MTTGIKVLFLCENAEKCDYKVGYECSTNTSKGKGTGPTFFLCEFKNSNHFCMNDAAISEELKEEYDQNKTSMS